MLDIKVNIKSIDEWVKPQEMFNDTEGSIFQQYFNSKSSNWYYVNCGINEPLLVIWLDDSNKWCFSHETIKSIKQLVPAVKFKRLNNVKLNVSLESLA